MKKLIFALILVSFSSTFAGSYEHNLELARRFLAIKKYDKAEEVLDRLIQEQPDDPALVPIMKEVYTNLKQYGKLIAVLHEQLDANPNSTLLNIELGDAYLAIGKLDSAKTFFRRAIKLTPEDDMIYRTVYQKFSARGYVDEAIEIIERARKQSSNPSSFLLDLARCYEIKGDYDKAVGLYIDYLSEHPDQVRVVESRLNSLGRTREDVEELEKAITSALRRRKSLFLYDFLVNILEREAKYREAFQWAVELWREKGVNEAKMLGIGRLAYNSGDYETALEVFGFLKENVPLNALGLEPQLYSARSLAAIGRLDEAKREYSSLMEKGNNDVKASVKYDLGMLALKQGSFDEALGHFQQATELTRTPEVVVASAVGYARALMMTGKLKQAREFLAGYLVRYPKSDYLVYEYGQLLFVVNEYDSCTAVFKDFFIRFPTSLYENDAIRLRLILTDYKEDEKTLKKLSAAELSKLAGDYRTALSVLCEIEKPDDHILFMKAGVFDSLGDFPDALDAYRRIIQEHPEGFYAPLAYERMGDIYLERGELPLARASYEKLLTNYPDALNSQDVREKIDKLEGKI